MSEADLFQVFGQWSCNFTVRQPSSISLPSPRSNMELVNRYRSGSRLAAASIGHPSRIIPLVTQVPDDGCGARWLFRIERKGIGLFEQLILTTGQSVFVNSASGA